jgi:hypothetical protein
VVASVALLALCLRTASRSPDVTTAFVAGITVIFVLTTPVCYYAAFFVLLVLVRPARSAATLLAANLLMYGATGVVLALAAGGVIRLNGAAVFVPVSVLFAAVLIDWLLAVSRRPWPAPAAVKTPANQ